MPNCFTLTLKGQTIPSTLTDIDAAICKHMGIEVHPTKYAFNWYNTIGLALACGKDWQWIREVIPREAETLKIVDYLEANYIPNAWYQVH